MALAPGLFSITTAAGLLRDALADGAPDLVGGAAGREGHDEGDGLGGKDWAEAASGRAAASSKASRFRGVRIVCLLCVFL